MATGTRSARVYWSGPYDGSPVMIGGTVVPLDSASEALALPAHQRYDELGNAAWMPVDAHELYVWCPDHGRYEWHGTHTNAGRIA